jgi:myo-inositol-1(or 4)-monophosphatase
VNRWSPHDLEHAALETARMAAQHIRDRIEPHGVLATKSTPTDVVTRTDMAVEELIRGELERRVPGSSIVGEEFEDVEGHTGIGWIIDPLDGTVNFVYGLPIVSVSIGATLDGEPAAGVVVDVFGGEAFTASRGGGAFLDGRPIEVTGQSDLSASLLCTGFSYDAQKRGDQAERLGDLLRRVSNLRALGSAALHLCWVAVGRFDGYFETDLKRWDYAAGTVIAAEAGARVEMPSAENGDFLFVTTPGIFDELRPLVAPA